MGDSPVRVNAMMKEVEAALQELLEARNAHVASLNDYKTTRDQFITTRNRLLAAWDDAALVVGARLLVSKELQD